MQSDEGAPHADLLSWIATGTLAGVAPGDSKAKVRDLWGPPLGWASTSDHGEIADFMDANWWGHGVWSTEFEGDVLDCVICCLSEVAQAGWYFQMAPLDESFHSGIDEAERILASAGIPCIRPPMRRRLRNLVTGDVTEQRRRLALPTLLAGRGFQTRILYEEDGRLRNISHPVSIRRQVVGYGRALGDTDYVLEFDPET